MNNTLTNVLVFVAGAGIGSAVTWRVVSSKYEQILKEEIQSVKDTFAKKRAVVEPDDENVTTQVINTDDDTAKVKVSNEEREKYYNILGSNGYTDYRTAKEGYEQTSFDKPYVIPPEDFGECEYETISLTYYSDGVLADDMDEIVDDVDTVVGDDFATHFGEYEEDSVFIRNDDRRCDYEILFDPRKYYDLHQREDE